MFSFIFELKVIKIDFVQSKVFYFHTMQELSFEQVIILSP